MYQIVCSSNIQGEPGVDYDEPNLNPDVNPDGNMLQFYKYIKFKFILWITSGPASK
jgi:hypothetical protein